MKKMLACLLCISLLLGMAMCGMTAEAAEVKEKSGRQETVQWQGIKYTLYNDYAVIEEYDKDVYIGYHPEFAQNRVLEFPRTFTIQETGETLPVTEIHARYSKLSPKTVIYHNGIKKFWSGLASAKELESVIFEEGIQIEEIPPQAFSYCENLSHVGIGDTDKLPDSITEIGGLAFSN